MRKVIVVLGGILLLIVAFMLVSSLLGGGDKSQQQKLLTVAQDQTELIRVAQLAKEERSIRDTKTLVFANNTELSLITSKQQVMRMLSKKKKVNEKLLVLKKDAKTDTALKSAAQNNNFDKVFTDILKKELTAYKADLNVAIEATSNKTDKKQLTASLEGATLLLGDK